MIQESIERVATHLNEEIKQNMKPLALGSLLPLGVKYFIRKGTEMMEEAYDNDLLKPMDTYILGSEYFQKGFLYCASAVYSSLSIIDGLEHDINHMINGDIQPLTVATLTAVVLGNIAFHLMDREEIEYS